MDTTQFLSGTVKEWPAHIYMEFLRYRHRIFIEKLGWNLPRHDGMEFDQFDREDTIHIAARNRVGEINAYSRLLPTLKPYLLAEVFPQLMDSRCLPRRRDTWELSRFTARDPYTNGPAARQFFFSLRSVELLCHSVATASLQGAKNLVFVGSPGMVTLMARANFNVQAIGPAKIIDGHRILAAQIKF